MVEEWKGRTAFGFILKDGKRRKKDGTTCCCPYILVEKFRAKNKGNKGVLDLGKDYKLDIESKKEKVTALSAEGLVDLLFLVEAGIHLLTNSIFHQVC